MTEQAVEQESLPEDPNGAVEQEIAQPEQEVEIDVSNIPATPVPGAGNEPVEEVDERGVPMTNVAREYQRKFEKTQQELAQMKDTLSQIQQNTEPQAQKEYTIEQIEAAKLEYPEHAAALEAEKMRVLQKNMLAALREEQEQDRLEQQKELQKQAELRNVATNYPQMFVKGANGQLVGWDAQSPLTKQATVYLNQGHGISTAAKLAYADLAQAGLLEANKAAIKQKAEVGDLHRKVAVEGGGVNAGSVNVNAEAMNTVKQTGDRKAATQVLGNIFRQVGKLQD